MYQRCPRCLRQWQGQGQRQRQGQWCQRYSGVGGVQGARDVLGANNFYLHIYTSMVVF